MRHVSALAVACIALAICQSLATAGAIHETRRLSAHTHRFNGVTSRRMQGLTVAKSASIAPPASYVLAMNCSGWPEKRRYVEVASWWTDDGVTPSSNSHRASIGTCIPVDAVTGPIVVDVGIKLANCLKKPTLQVSKIFISSLYVTLMQEEYLGLYCCGLPVCEQSLRYSLNMTSLATNGNATLDMGLVVSVPSTDRLYDNVFSTVKVTAPIKLSLPNVTKEVDLQGQDLGASGTGHGAWQAQYVNLKDLPGLVKGESGKMVPLQLEFSKYPSEDSTTPAANFTGLLVTVDPTPANMNGTALLSYQKIDVPYMVQWPFVDATDTSGLTSGTHLVMIRADAAIPTKKMPTDATLPLLQRTGGAHSVSFTFSWKK